MLASGRNPTSIVTKPNRSLFLSEAGNPGLKKLFKEVTGDTGPFLAWGPYPQTCKMPYISCSTQEEVGKDFSRPSVKREWAGSLSIELFYDSPAN